MTLNDFNRPPSKKKFIVNCPQFLAAAHVLTVNYDDMAGDILKQPAHKIFSIKRRF